MKNFKELISRDSLHYKVYASISAAAAVLAGIVYATENHFERFFGDINPMFAFFIIIILGLVLFSILLSRGWFAVRKRDGMKGLLQASALASLFGVIIILVDLKVVFPAGINVPFPQSLLFYPAIAFFVEILFHVLPMTVLLLFLASLFRNIGETTAVRIGIVIVSLPEAVFQAVSTDLSGTMPLWASAYVGLHVFLINLSQLIIFRRFDFVSMYTFRIVYYLFWHIGWGYFRLQILF